MYIHDVVTTRDIAYRNTRAYIWTTEQEINNKESTAALNG